MLIDPAGRYRIERRLGKGGFGEAYLAHDTRLDRRCVVKRLVPDASWSARTQQIAVEAFTREAQILVSLNTPGHPNIPEIYDFFAESRCLVMKYVVGDDLGRVIRHSSAVLPLDDVLQIAHDVCSAIFYLHSRMPAPVLHRDIKPANLLRDSEGRIWLIDFGLAQDAMIAAELATGTPGYAPPEQWRGQSQPASDIYSFGATIYTLLTGGYPPPAQILPAITPDAAGSEGRLLPNVPEVLEALIWHTMAVEPAARPDARECLDVIDALLVQSRIPPPPALPQPPVLPVFVGREAELATLEARLADEHALVLTGIAGIGKTALASTLAAQISAPEALFWYRFAAGTGAEELIWGLAIFLAHRGGADLWAMLQRARQSRGALPPATVLGDYACALLRDDQAEPLLLLDDLHLVEDNPGVRALCERLVAEARTGSLRLLITSRSVPQLGADLALYRVEGLDLTATRALLAGRGLSLSAAQLMLLLQATGGNAQLLGLAGEVLRQQRQSDPETIIAQLATSSNIERFLLREVDAALSDQERTAMRAVAVLLDAGGTGDAVEALLDANPQRTLHELAARGLLTVAESGRGRVYTQHAILQEFFYAQLSRRERRRLHRRAAAFYDEEEPNALRAALHYQRADEVERAAEIVARDAWAIVGAGQARSLRMLLERLRAADLAPSLRAQLLIACGDVETLVGEPDSVRQSYEDALAALDGADVSPGARVLRARACRGIGRLLELSLPQEALDWLTRGHTELAEADLVEEAELANKLGGVLIRQGDLARAQAALERAEALLPPGPSQLRINVLHTLGTLYSTRGDIARGMAYTRQGIAVCEQLHDSIRAGTMLTNLAVDQLFSGDLAAAQANLRRARDLAEQTGNRQLQLLVLLNLGFSALRTGDHVIADQTLWEGIQLAQDLQAHLWEITERATLADLRIRQGRVAEAEQMLTRAEDLATATHADAMLPELARLRASLLLAQEHPEAALEFADRALALATEQQNDLDIGYALHILGRAQCAAGDRLAARESLARAVDLLATSDRYEAAQAQLAWAEVIESDEPATATALRTAGRAELVRQGVGLLDEQHPYAVVRSRVA